jgi:hypothetical protein
MKILFRTVAAATLLALAAGPALAHSQSYCASVARHDANFQTGGKTVVGAGLGCLVGALIAHRCGIGAAVGGVGGFAIGSNEWQHVYNQSYQSCRYS